MIDGIKMMPIGSICDVTGGKRLPKGRALMENDTGLKYIRLNDFSASGFAHEDIKFLPKDLENTLARYRVETDDIILSVAGTLGMVRQIPKALHGAYLTENADRMSNFKGVSPEYLFQILNSHWMNKLIASSSTKSGQPKLALERIRAFLIPVPSSKEQLKIVEILSDCDTAIASLIQEKQSTERVLTFSQKEIFRPYVCGTDTEKKAEPIHKLGELFSERVETGNENLPLVSITMGRGVIPREEVGRKDSSSDDKSKYRRICVGDVGYNTMRMWQGVNGLSSIDGIVSPAYTICIPNTEKIHPDWAAHLFKEKRMIFQFWRHSQGLVNDTLGLKFPAFAEIKIRIPNLQTQANDVQHMAALYKHHSLLDTQIENLKKQKRGLMQQLLTGELRVKGVA
jgi:type I restriction enzyme S subunit